MNLSHSVDGDCYYNDLFGFDGWADGWMDQITLRHFTQACGYTNMYVCTYIQKTLEPTKHVLDIINSYPT